MAASGAETLKQLQANYKAAIDLYSERKQVFDSLKPSAQVEQWLYLIQALKDKYGYTFGYYAGFTGTFSWVTVHGAAELQRPGYVWITEDTKATYTIDQTGYQTILNGISAYNKQRKEAEDALVQAGRMAEVTKIALEKFTASYEKTPEGKTEIAKQNFKKYAVLAAWILGGLLVVGGIIYGIVYLVRKKKNA